MTLSQLEIYCRNFITSLSTLDSAHDLAHIQRVVTNAKIILSEESADTEIVLASAWLHDCVVLPKNHSNRKQASTLAAKKAIEFLSKISFPKSKLDDVSHAIKSHSFSAEIQPETVEAKIVQDADRLDALGAIGIARCFAVGGQLDRKLYNSTDPFCEVRTPDDGLWTLDHFYAKLFKLPKTMNTRGAKNEAIKRVEFMELYLKQLQTEID